MADYVSREVARERLRKACRGGSLISALVLVLGLCYAAVAAVIGTGVRLPFDFMYAALYATVPTMGDDILAASECGTKAVLLLLMGLFGLLAFGRVARTGDAFRAGQLKQLRFMALLSILLGFLPTVVGNAFKIALAMQSGGPAVTMMSFAVEPMCVLVGIVGFVAARMLVAGSVLGTHEDMLASDGGIVEGEPDYGGVPDLSNVPTAAAEPDQTVVAPTSLEARTNPFGDE